MKLYAIYDKDGNLAKRGIRWDGFAHDTKWAAWRSSGFTDNSSVRRAKREGYTCEEVEIVRKGTK